MSEHAPEGELSPTTKAVGVAALGLAAVTGVGVEAYDQLALHNIEHDPKHAVLHREAGSVDIAKLSPEDLGKVLQLMNQTGLRRAPTVTEIDLFDKFAGTALWGEFVKVMHDHPLLIDEAYAIGKRSDPDFSIIK